MILCIGLVLICNGSTSLGHVLVGKRENVNESGVVLGRGSLNEWNKQAKSPKHVDLIPNHSFFDDHKDKVGAKW